MLLSIKGPNGGYRLARPAHDITMLEILEAVDGPIRGQAPFSRSDPSSPLNRRLDAICNQAALFCSRSARHLPWLASEFICARCANARWPAATFSGLQYKASDRQAKAAEDQVKDCPGGTG